MSLASAAQLALQNSPQVKIAHDNLNHATAALAEAKDQFIPSANATGGVGRSYGITLQVPTIFTLNTQSLLFNYSQRDYIRSARAGLQASTLALEDVKLQVEEDTILTYLSLQAAQERQSAATEKRALAEKLYAMVQDRLTVGIESELDLKKAHLTAVQVRLQQLGVEDEVASLRQRLADLTGVAADRLTILAQSIPKDFSLPAPDVPQGDSLGVRSADANARSRLEQAFGDERFRNRPQFFFQAQYGRISPINDVSDYYNLQGRYNTFEAGIAVQFAFFDSARSARSRESMADAMRAQHEAQNIRTQQAEGRLALEHSVLELSTRAELAEVELGIAQDELTMMLAEVESRSQGSAGRAMTAKDEQNARLDERQRYIDWIDANLQLHRAQVSALRQSGSLDAWLTFIAANPSNTP